jgi:hypothetical protein
MTMSRDLLTILDQAGVEGLRDGRTEIFALCPSPSHDERHPSWSINKTTYLHHCFSCGFSGTLTGLLHQLGGADADVADIEVNLRTQGFLRQMERVRREPERTLAPVLPLLTEWSLVNVLADVPERLLAFRRLKRAAADAFQVRWSGDTREWVLPLRSPTGVLLGAQYKRVGSVLTLPAGLPKGSTLFGLAQMESYDVVVLVESPLDAVRLFGLGIPALASLGAWVTPEQVTLLARTFAVVYIALDDDKAGREGTARTTEMLRRRGCAAVPWSYQGLVDEDGHKAKDPGDVASDEALVAAWTATRRCGL